MNSLRTQSWNKAWAETRFRRAFVAALLLLAVTLTCFRAFLDFIELRPGTVLNDPIVALFPATDLTWITFILIYGGLLSGIAVLSVHPHLLHKTIMSYILMILIRTVCLYATPLDPPSDSIPLTDPVVEFFGGSGTTLTRDLFFSGHTATLALIGMSMPVRTWRHIILAATGCVAVCVLIQHVHYTVDILVAPLAAYTSLRIVRLLSLE